MKTKDRKKYICLVSIAITIFTVLIIFSSVSYIKKENILNANRDEKIETSLLYTGDAEQEFNEEYTQNEQKENQIQQEDTATIEESILTTYKGYPVVAKLDIPKIELETYVISAYSENALRVSVTKFYGGNPNEVGNFCIAGHNYITKNMFHDLKKISVGDTIFLTDSSNQEVMYMVYSVETVEPNETQCLSQKTKGRVELTLITCTTDSSKRIIVKAVKN